MLEELNTGLPENDYVWAELTSTKWRSKGPRTSS